MCASRLWINTNFRIASKPWFVPLRVLSPARQHSLTEPALVRLEWLPAVNDYAGGICALCGNRGLRILAARAGPAVGCSSSRPKNFALANDFGGGHSRNFRWQHERNLEPGVRLNHFLRPEQPSRSADVFGGAMAPNAFAYDSVFQRHSAEKSICRNPFVTKLSRVRPEVGSPELLANAPRTASLP